jgi:two-component system, cell cycle sensor histidine kinase PleC
MDEIDARREELSAAVEQLQAEIEQLREQQRQLRAEADAMMAAHVNFVACMRLELNTPLAMILGFSELMKTEPFGPLDPRYKDYLERIREGGARLQDIVTAILDDAIARQHPN